MIAFYSTYICTLLFHTLCCRKNQKIFRQINVFTKNYYSLDFTENFWAWSRFLILFHTMPFYHNVVALNFDYFFYEVLHFLKNEMEWTKSLKFVSPKIGSVRTSRFSKVDFTQNLSDRKILKFPHHVLGLASSFWNRIR